MLRNVAGGFTIILLSYLVNSLALQSKLYKFIN